MTAKEPTVLSNNAVVVGFQKGFYTVDYDSIANGKVDVAYLRSYQIDPELQHEGGRGKLVYVVGSHSGLPHLVKA